MFTSRPVSSTAPAQATGPAPVVEIAPVTSGLAVSRETIFEIDYGRSKPSSTAGSTLMSGYSSFIFEVNAAATPSSTGLNPP